MDWVLCRVAPRYPPLPASCSKATPEYLPCDDRKAQLLKPCYGLKLLCEPKPTRFSPSGPSSSSLASQGSMGGALGGRGTETGHVCAINAMQYAAQSLLSVCPPQWATMDD